MNGQQKPFEPDPRQLAEGAVAGAGAGGARGGGGNNVGENSAGIGVSVGGGGGGGDEVTAVSGGLVNGTEVELTRIIVEGLAACGIAPTDIGVISPYRSQLSLIEKKLEKLKMEGLEVSTVDKFQGRDKLVIVLSLVRSNSAHEVGDLLRDWRRVNVAFTRSKAKLILVGSAGTLEGTSQNHLSAFISLLRRHGWIYALPFRAEQRY